MYAVTDEEKAIADRILGELEERDKGIGIKCVVEDMTILPDRQRYARAVCTIRAGPIVFYDCMVLGDSSASPATYTLTLPGKRVGTTQRSKWRPLVSMDEGSYLYRKMNLVAVAAYTNMIHTVAAETKDTMVGEALANE